MKFVQYTGIDGDMRLAEKTRAGLKNAIEWCFTYAAGCERKGDTAGVKHWETQLARLTDAHDRLPA